MGPATSHGPVDQVELVIEGMTCASCAARVEKRLSALEGVSATVNYATAKARATVPEGTEPAVLVAAVEAAGYHATLPPSRTTPPPATTPTASAPATSPPTTSSSAISATTPSAPATSSSATSSSSATAPPADSPLDALRRRVFVSGVLSLPVIAMSMVPALQFTWWQWISLALTTPVVVWGASPFHRAA
ncbi:MAG: cation transporter, partial [Dermatophilaceae bacterium]